MRSMSSRLQDDYLNAVEPTATMTFSKHGVRDFTVQVLDGDGLANGRRRRRERQ